MKENSMPLVSIISSMFNVAAFLPQMIESLIGQTYHNIEIILVDDGSPDDSRYIAERYASKDSRIKVIHQLNKGFGGGRNTGIDNANGQYITFVDADDYIAPDFVEYMLLLENKTNAEIVLSKNCFTTANLSQVTNDKIEIYSPEKAIEEFFYPRIQLGAWNKMYNMNLIKKYNLRFVPELKTGEGLQFITNAAYYANQIGVGNRKVYIYRINNLNSATTKANVEKQGIGSIETLKYIGQHLPMKTFGIKKAYKWHLWASYRYCLRQIIESGTKNSYPELYKKCCRKIRYGFLIGIIANVSMKNKLLAMVALISPYFTVYLHLQKKKRRF